MAVAVGMIGAAVVGGMFSSKAQKKAASASNRALAAQLAFQKEQQAKLDAQKEIYKQFKFENPYEGLENPYTDMENVYEDLTVSTQAADFAIEQAAQQRANIMQQMRGAAGGSGIAGLAQALAGQGALQSRQASIGIAQQERANMLAKAGGAAEIQQLERQGASAVDMAVRGGQAMVQEAEMSRQATLLGVAYGGTAGANAGVQAAYANQMAVNTAGMQMQMQNIKSITSAMGQVNWGGGSTTTPTTTGAGSWEGVPYTYNPPPTTYGPHPEGSDRRLKKNINLIGESPSGLNIYSFEYIDNKYGEGTYQGAMSDEIPSYAVSVNSDGYDMVDYSKIDVNFKQI